MSSSSTWTIEGFCESQLPSDWSLLHESSLLFLQRLNLSSTHPFCAPETAPRPYDLPGVPPQGPLQSQDHLESIWDVVITVLAMGGPSVLAMGELWLRLFSSLIAPLGVAHLLWDQVVSTVIVPAKQQQQQKESPRKQTFLSVVCLFTVASSIVLFTDTLYVLEFGPHYGFVLWTLSTLLALLVARRHQLIGVLAGKLCLFLLMVYLVYDIETGQLTFGHSDEECHVQEGLYYDHSNGLAKRLVDHWPEPWRRYDVEHGATSWMPTGDARTGLPFLLNFVPNPTWTRVWVPLQDGEVAALDISFPATGLHDTSKPLYMLLHGLNGGSTEEYVKDFTWRRNAEGSTVAVFIARGLMDLPVRGWDVFHGARYSDAHEAARALRAGMVEGQVLAGVGYSMGGIILANYVTRLGNDCALDAAVSISGGLDLRYVKEFYRAQRLWQPILTKTLRESFVVGKWGERAKSRLTKQELKEMLRAYHITEIDKTAVVAYNKFRDLDHYYSEMSALGDIPIEDHVFPTVTQGRILNLSIPLCVVHALDDPLITWRSVAANEGLLHPGNLTKLGSGNLFLLLTKRGGHVGWPLGWKPSQYNWKWMNDAAMSFVEAYVQSRTNA